MCKRYIDFVVTKRNEDGSYDEVGTNNRFRTTKYQSVRTLIQYGVPEYYKDAGFRVEKYRYGGVIGTATIPPRALLPQHK